MRGPKRVRLWQPDSGRPVEGSGSVAIQAHCRDSKAQVRDRREDGGAFDTRPTREATVR